MRSNPFSIRKRLLVMMSLVLVFVCGTSIWAANIYATKSAKSSYDRLLYGAALQILENVSKLDGQILIDIPISAFETMAMAENDRGFYSIRSSNGVTLTGYTDLPIPDLASVPLPDDIDTLEPFYYDAVFRGYDTRFIAVAKPLIELNEIEPVYVILGQTLSSREAMKSEMNAFTLQFVSIFVVLTLAGLLIGIWFVLRPLAVLRREIGSRKPTALTPLAINVPYEIQPLLETLNFFIEQLRVTLERLKRLTAEAAHQIRTPLAGLRSQAQNALEESNEEIRHAQLIDIVKSSENLTETITQILNQATLAHRFQSEQPEIIELSDVVQDVCRDLVVWALDQKRYIEFHGDHDIHILGDTFAIKQMLRNVIENAVKYSPKSSVVEVQLFGTGSTAVVKVKDNGEGIPTSEKSKVFEPFYRSGNGRVCGSGIGLSIAKEVAEHHKALLLLGDNTPTGLIVTITFDRLDNV